MHTISEVIYRIIHDYGVDSLLDSKFVLAVFADLAPNLRKERELLRSFLLCGGAEKLIDAVDKSADDLESQIEQTVKSMEENQWTSRQAAQHICAEVYKGITNKEYAFGLQKKENIKTRPITPRSNGVKRISIKTLSVIVAPIILGLVVICLIISNRSIPHHTKSTERETFATEKQTTVHIHTWGEALCGIPQTCVNCGEIGSIVAEHIWKPASFANPKTCEVCGAVDGSPISHSSISVEEEVQLIREYYNAIESNISAEKYKNIELRQGVEGYYNNSGALACVYVCRGTEGIGNYSDTYSRFYYFKNGEVFFVFFEGTDSHRLYFLDEMLMRWRYTSIEGEPINYDFGGSSEFDFWEQLALKEADTFT